MKIKLIILFIASYSLSLLSQNGNESTYRSVMDKIMTTYNNKNYKGFYNLLSEKFRSSMSEKELTTFLSENLFEQLGRIQSITYYKEEKGAKIYKTQFEKDSLSLTIACNYNSEIELFLFKPFEEKNNTYKKNSNSTNAKKTELDLIVDSIVSNYASSPLSVGLSIGIILNNKTFYYHYGAFEKGTNKLPTNETIYEIGSISKTFTGTLLAKAIEDNKVKLEDDIRKYLPASCARLEYKGSAIILKHLVNHTSRIPKIPTNLMQQKEYNLTNPYKNYTKKLLYEYLSTLQIDTLPGLIQEYSNTGMALLGIILQTVYKKSYEQLIQEYITKPIGMNKTFVTVPSTLENFYTKGYTNGVETNHWDLGDIPGCGGIKSTIEDMLNYMNANLNETKTFYKTAHQITYQKGKQSSAFAWFINSNTEPPIIWHNGGTGGFTSFCGMIKGKKCAVILLSNTSDNRNEVNEMGVTILKYLQK